MLRLSTGLRNKLLKDTLAVNTLITSTTVSVAALAGVNGSDRISDATNFATFPATLVIGDSITLLGTHTNSGKTGTIVGYGTGYIDVSGAALVTMAAGASVNVVGAVGGSMAGALRNGKIHIYSGAQPATADAGETGTLLCVITLASGAHATAAAGTNGINFGVPANGVMAKPVEVWSGANVASGVAGWFRYYSNAATTGASTTAVRLDGSCATSGGQCRLSTTTLVENVVTTVDSVAVTMPAN